MIAFDDNSQVVAVTEFVYPDDEQKVDSESSAENALHVLRQGLGLVIVSGHRDAIAARLAALGVLAGTFATVTEAAAVVGLSRQGIARQVQRLRVLLREQCGEMTCK